MKGDQTSLAHLLSAVDGQQWESRDIDISHSDAVELAEWMGLLTAESPPASFDGASLLAAARQMDDPVTAPIAVVDPVTDTSAMTISAMIAPPGWHDELAARRARRRRRLTGLLAAAAVCAMVAIGIPVWRLIADNHPAPYASNSADEVPTVASRPLSGQETQSAPRAEVAPNSASATGPAAQQDAASAQGASCPLSETLLAAAQQHLPSSAGAAQVSNCRANWTTATGASITLVVRRAPDGACLTGHACEPADGGYLRRTGSVLAVFAYRDGWEVVITTTAPGYDAVAALGTARAVLSALG